MKSCWLSVSVVITLIALLLGWRRYDERQQVANVPVDLYRGEFEFKNGWNVGPCDYPSVFRNVVDFGEHNYCKTNAPKPGSPLAQSGSKIDPEGDYCISFIKDRMTERWGDRIIEAFPASHVSNHAGTGYYESSSMTLYDYFNDPQFKDYLVHTLHQLGVREEYREFLMFDHKDGKHDLYGVVRSIPEWIAMGSQFFMSQKLGSGSVLHFAFGANLFVMLAGRKRWIVVHPAYTDDAGCVVGVTGIYGDCTPNGYLPKHSNITLDVYKDILLNDLKIPENAIFDFTLNPGDILVNPPLWAHTIENLENTTIAYSFRATNRQKHFNKMSFLTKFASGLYQSLRTKLYLQDWEKFTIADYLVLMGKSGQDKIGMLDEDNRFDGKSFINSKDEDKDERLETTQEKIQQVK